MKNKYPIHHIDQVLGHIHEAKDVSKTLTPNQTTIKSRSKNHIPQRLHSTHVMVIMNS